MVFDSLTGDYTLRPHPNPDTSGDYLLSLLWERIEPVLGHPVGATGAIMTVKLMEELERSDQQMGLVTMCVGGGQGVATIFERVG